MHSKKDNINKSKNFIQGLRPFSSSLPHGLKKILKKGGYNFSNIVNNWTKMVGENVSSCCYPSTIKMSKEMNDGILILNVIHGNEVNIEYGKQEIIDKINSFFGFRCIKEIKLKIIENRKIQPKTKNKMKQIDFKYKEKLENIKNQDLKKSLNKLVKAYSKKND